MRTKIFKLFCLLITSGLVLSACNMQSAEATSTQPPATATLKATATPTAVPDTETPTATATETPVPEPSETSTPEPVTADVGRESNCRTGPAGNYELIATYQIGQKLEVVGKDLGNGYLFVKNPEKPEEQCYLLANNVTMVGDASTLPKFTPWPSPTAAPYFSVTFKKLNTCEGQDYALFVVVNEGSVPFRSVYIKVTDQKVGQSVEQVLNAFDLRVGCVLAKNIAPLNAGETGYVASPEFKWKVAGHKLRAVIQACTEKSLKGTCVIQSLDLQP